MKIKSGWFLWVLLPIFFSSCATTGPSISSAELKQSKEEFQQRFYEASKLWMPRIYRVGYRLLTSPIPGVSDSKEEYSFTGVGVDELKDPARKVFGVSSSVQGVLVLGTYPGSKAENVDVQIGDVITKIDGQKVNSLGSYFKKVRSTTRPVMKAEIMRRGKLLYREFPVEKVHYNAQFFLEATPSFEANSLFSRIQVGIGAIRYCRNDDELATIMGHELAHTVRKHSLKKMGAGIGTALAYGAVAGTIDAFTFPGLGNVLLNPAQKATDAAISREYEREADYFGMQHAFHAGFNVQEGAKVFARLASDAPGLQVLAYTFSSHPESPERFLRLEKMIDEFKTKYPKKFPLPEKTDWELVIPVKTGESTEEILQNLLEREKKLKAALLQKSMTGETKKTEIRIEPPKSEESISLSRVEKVMEDFEFSLDEEVTTSGTNKASSANPDKAPASEHPEPSTS